MGLLMKAKLFQHIDWNAFWFHSRRILRIDLDLLHALLLWNGFEWMSFDFLNIYIVLVWAGNQSLFLVFDILSKTQYRLSFYHSFVTLWPRVICSPNMSGVHDIWWMVVNAPLCTLLPPHPIKLSHFSLKLNSRTNCIFFPGDKTQLNT